MRIRCHILKPCYDTNHEHKPRGAFRAAANSREEDSKSNKSGGCGGEDGVRNYAMNDLDIFGRIVVRNIKGVALLFDTIMNI